MRINLFAGRTLSFKYLEAIAPQGTIASVFSLIIYTYFSNGKITLITNMPFAVSKLYWPR